MENKINVIEAKINGDWCNIKTSDGKEISCMISKAPKIKNALEQAQQQGFKSFDLECKLVDKNGKIYAWDLEEKKQGSGNGFKGQPKDEGLIIAQSCLNYSTQYHQQRQGSTEDKIFDLAERMYKWVLTKSTKQTNN